MSKRYTCTLCNGTGGFSHTVRHTFGCRGDYYPTVYVTRTHPTPGTVTL